MKQPNYYGRSLMLLHRLKDLYPMYTMGRHLSTVLDDCGDVWGLTDKELFAELNEYKRQLEMDKPHDDSEIEIIIKEGMNLNRIFIEDTEINTDNGDF